MAEWKTYKLSEIATLLTGFPFAGEKYTKEGIRVVRGDNVTIGALRWDSDKLKCWKEPFVRADDFSLMKKVVRKGSLIVCHFCLDISS